MVVHETCAVCSWNHCRNSRFSKHHLAIHISHLVDTEPQFKSIFCSLRISCNQRGYFQHLLIQTETIKVFVLPKEQLTVKTSHRRRYPCLCFSVDCGNDLSDVELRTLHTSIHPHVQWMSSSLISNPAGTKVGSLPSRIFAQTNQSMC